MDQRKITVEYMDGRIETPFGVPALDVVGLLTVREYTGVTHTLMKTTRIPLANVRKWTDGQE